MQIIGINGVWCRDNPIWNNLIPAFKERFPGASFPTEELRNCHPWEVSRLQRFAEGLVETYDTGEDTLLVGHSMGGVIACAIASRYRYSKVLGIVTIFSPHRFLGGIFPTVLGRLADEEISLLSFGAKRDWLVWWGARHARSVAHVELRSNHFRDLVERYDLAERIANETKQHLFP